METVQLGLQQDEDYQIKVESGPLYVHVTLPDGFTNKGDVSYSFTKREATELAAALLLTALDHRGI